MATIALKNKPLGICNQIWEMGKISFSGSKLKIIDSSGKANAARFKYSKTLLVEIIEFDERVNKQTSLGCSILP